MVKGKKLLCVRELLFFCKKLPKNKRNVDDFCQIRYNKTSNNADGTKGFYPNANDVNEKGRL